jgi:hypothetical protein
MTACADCGKPLRKSYAMLNFYHGGTVRSDHFIKPSRCEPCLADTARRVEAFAAAWVPILMASMAMNGGLMPEIDSALQRKPAEVAA